MSFPCGPCKLSFDKPHKLDTHRRCVHQADVTVTTAHGDKVDLHRMRDSSHVKTCLATGPPLSPLERHVEPNVGVIVPMDQEVQSNDLLGQYHLAWNVCCQILICTECHAGVVPEEVAAHLKTHHKQDSKVKQEEVMENLKEYVIQVNEGPRPLDYVKGKRLPPLEGLIVYNGYTCKICDRSWQALRTAQNHFGKKHRDLAGERDNHIQTDKCQHLYGHHHSCHFPVLPYVRPAVASGPGMRSGRTPSPEVSDRGDAVHKLVNKLEEHAMAGVGPGPDSEFDKDTAHWLFISGIQTYIEGLIIKEKTHEDIVEAVQIDENVEKMIPFLASWINKTMKRLHQTGQMLKRVCLCKDDALIPRNLEHNKGLMPLQEKASVIKYACIYACILANFLWFLVLQTDIPVHTGIQLYNVHKPFIHQLKDMVLPLELRRQNLNQYGAEEIIPVENRALSKLASQILCKVFQVPAAARNCQYLFPPMQFLAFSVVKVDGSYEGVTTLTRLIAGMQYGVRLTFAEEYLDAPAPAFDPNADPTIPFKDDFSRFKYLHKNHAGPFNYVRQVMHLATTAIMSEALPETTFWADHHQETLEMDNKKVTIGGIRNCIQIQDKLVQQDLDAIVRGCKMPKLDLNLYKDKPNN
ncbi:uncharacterized protein MELLADRAFT_62530 [Melampsora larici-populina 98AG31]|uniref:C2H2-type domain-containing protein n=1 Tax=Melampsora larici-populina (strain 98AG31 / pathotype 3-4-7) TaxID=747676 RepID=F4RJ91_MELLP|nr:uncharacterized protein MELLADRAFT_62530 [Melampsora larici-populina 98AG31]EGG07544.1 hypothetical protein MELLADRAFT_62530 [Melampsora larici-populina 98AG31]